MTDFLLHSLIAYTKMPNGHIREMAGQKIAKTLTSHDEYVIAVDFDGTLCKNEWPDIGDPIPIMIEAAKEAKRRGAKLILYTCREGKLLCEAIAWCAVRKLTFDSVNANLQSCIMKYGKDCRKISFDELWDDRAVDISQEV